MRIVGGSYRGRRLKAPKGLSTRPTTERVREALFAIIGNRVVGARVADLFAGTGALGIEALSRGAVSVEAFEMRASVRRILYDNVSTLQLEHDVQVRGGRLPKCLGPGAPFDLVFMDPPWERELGPATMRALTTHDRLTPGALVVLEERATITADAATWLPADFELYEGRRYGDTGLIMATWRGPRQHKERPGGAENI